MRVTMRYEDREMSIQKSFHVEATRADIESSDPLAADPALDGANQFYQRDPLASLILDIARPMLIDMGLSDGSIAKASSDNKEDSE